MNLEYIEEDEGFLSSIVSQFAKIENYRNTLLAPSNKLNENFSYLAKTTYKIGKNKSKRYEISLI